MFNEGELYERGSTDYNQFCFTNVQDLSIVTKTCNLGVFGAPFYENLGHCCTECGKNGRDKINRRRIVLY